MNTTTYRNLTNGQVFTKAYESVYLQKEMMRKCRHSKKLKVLDWECNGYEEMQYLMGR